MSVDPLRRLRRDNALLASDNYELEELTAELKRSNQDLERFAYVASHDLSEPLRAVTAFTQKLADRYKGKLDPEADEYLEFILDGTERMRTLIRALLAYSRVGRAELVIESVDTGELVAEVLTSLVSERVAAVEVGELPRVDADRTQLGQVFQNLIGNALKFVDEETPRVRVEAEREEGRWRFDVIDNGIGIDPRYAGQIFDAFQRLHTRDHFEGAGIGLSICQRVVERHGGGITVAPAEGGGTVFSFTLPDRRPS
ncbi:MAG: multi-sensor signal transduction multi-kinase [Solirubrobacterales bacterium]|nr:multi-sensor signal transduction multi-kinase [Solirubrobacterales bacterium]